MSIVPKLFVQTSDTFNAGIAPNSLHSHPSETQTATPHLSPISHQLCLTSRLQSSQFWQSGVVSMLLVRPRRCKYSSIDSKKGCSSPCKLLPGLVWYAFEQSKSDVDASRACGQIVRPHRCKYSSIDSKKGCSSPCKLLPGLVWYANIRRQRDRLSKQWWQEHSKTIPPSPP